MIPAATSSDRKLGAPGSAHFEPGTAQEDDFAAPTRILIVEDNWIVAAETEDTLEEAGYTVLGIAVSAAEAVEACEADRPDLVLMDIRLLGARDGVDAAVEIRQRFGIGSIFMSAHDDAEVRARAALAKPLGWIVKPVSRGELVSSLAELGRDRGDC